MRSYVDTRSLEGCPLTLLARAPGVYRICLGEMEAGAITLKIAGRGEAWCWSVTGPHLPVFLQPGTGQAETLAEAQRALSEKIDQWRRWTRGSPALWNM